MSMPRYPEYQHSDLEWLGAVPAHWSLKRLRFVAELNPSKSETADLDRNTEVSFVPMEAIGDDGSLNLDRTRPICEVDVGYTYFRDGDVTLAKITPCFENGKGALMRGLHFGIGFGTTELVVARPKAGQTSGEFLNWLFRSPGFRGQGEASMYGAGGQKRVPDDFVRNITWAFPPPDEQAAIIAFLDRETGKIDALIAEQEKLITLLAEKREATISHAVTLGLNPNAPMKDSDVPWLGAVPAHWDVKPLKRVISDVKAGPFGSALTKDMYVASGYRVYGQEQVIPADFSIGDYYISKEKFGELVQYQVSPGDILISCVGTFGKIAIAPGDVEPGIINPRLIRMRVGKSLLGRYLEAVLRSSVVFEQFSFMSRGGTMDVINIGTLSAITLAVPPLVEQVGLLEFLDIETTKLDNLKVEAERAISLLRERRNALIAAAVTGQIDLRGPVVQQAASPELVTA